MNEWASFAWAIVGAIFAAGVSYGVFRTRVTQIYRDVNGLGAKTRQIEDKAADRFTALGFAVLLAAPDDKRVAIAGILLNAALRR